MRPPSDSRIKRNNPREYYIEWKHDVPYLYISTKAALYFRTKVAANLTAVAIEN